MPARPPPRSARAPPRPSSATRMIRRRPVVGHLDRGGLRPRVLDHVGERLGDHEVGRRLGRVAKRLGAIESSTATGSRAVRLSTAAARPRVVRICGANPEPRSRSSAIAVVVSWAIASQAGVQRRRLLSPIQRLADETQLEQDAHEPLLDAIMQITREPLALRRRRACSSRLRDAWDLLGPSPLGRPQSSGLLLAHVGGHVTEHDDPRPSPRDTVSGAEEYAIWNFVPSRRQNASPYPRADVAGRAGLQDRAVRRPDTGSRPSGGDAASRERRGRAARPPHSPGGPSAAGLTKPIRPSASTR